MELKSNLSAQYGLRHLRPGNLLELRKELRVQLAHLKPGAHQFAASEFSIKSSKSSEVSVALEVKYKS